MKVADALNGAVEAQCHNVSIDEGAADQHHVAPFFPTTSARTSAAPSDAVIVAASGGDDANPGTVAKPKATIQAGVLAARNTASKTVLLRGGMHMIRTTVHITPADSGLTISNYNGEDAVVSGAIPIETKWKRVPSFAPSSHNHIGAANTHRAGVDDTDVNADDASAHADIGAECTMKEDPPDMIRIDPGVYRWIALTKDNVSSCMAACCADPKCVVASYNTAPAVCHAAGHNVT